MRTIRSYPIAFIAGAFLLGALASLLVMLMIGADEGELEARSSEQPSQAPSPSPSPTATETAAAAPAECGDPTALVESSDELIAALAAAAPGDVIVLAAGTYRGNFVASASGTAGEPIALCGTADSILDGGDVGSGYVFHLNGAAYWQLSGFSVTNGQKGVMADATVGSVIEGLTVSRIGDEAIHLRKFSTDNVVRGNTISDTGHRKPKFGEGIYIGSAESNWCDITGCQPDRSDRNVIEGNLISGTTGGVLRGNSFDGSALQEADSWVDVKGNDWLIDGNSGTNSHLDGFQTHEIIDGWGTGNTFTNNSATVNGDGFGFSLTPARDNVVECSNAVSAAREGYSNVDCST